MCFHCTYQRYCRALENPREKRIAFSNAPRELRAGVERGIDLATELPLYLGEHRVQLLQEQVIAYHQQIDVALSDRLLFRHRSVNESAANSRFQRLQRDSQWIHNTERLDDYVSKFFVNRCRNIRLVVPLSPYRAALDQPTAEQPAQFPLDGARAGLRQADQLACKEAAFRLPEQQGENSLLRRGEKGISKGEAPARRLSRVASSSGPSLAPGTNS